MDLRNKRLRDLPSKISAILRQIDEHKGQWIGGAKLNPQLLGRLKKSVLASSTGASTRIEGSRMSDEDVEKLMRGLSMQKFIDRDKQEVRGYYELLENIFGAWERTPFSESTIKHLHKELLKYADKDVRHRGEYKKTENSVEMFDADGKSLGVVFETTPAYLAPKQMQELVDWTRAALEKGEEHPLLVVGNFIVEFLAIHPFQDGNGRLSRILTNLLMLKAGYEYVPYVSHEKLVEENKSEYYIALRRSQKTLRMEEQDVSAWLTFFLDISAAQVDQAIKLLSAENIEKILSVKQLVVWRFIQSVGDASRGEIAAATGIAVPTVNQSLEVLLKLQRVRRIGQGRSTRYEKLMK